MTVDIRLPDLGDGIETGDVLEVLVKEGEEIVVEQGLIELETDKATVEVPSTHTGRVTKIHVSPGQSIPVGAKLISVETATEAAGLPTTDAEQTTKSDSPPAVADQTPLPSTVGPPDAQAPSHPPTEPVSPRPTKPSAQREHVTSDPSPHKAVPAGPAIRRFARETGVDLQQVRGTGEGGRITREDVLNVVRTADQTAISSATSTEQPPAVVRESPSADIDRDHWGPVRYVQLPRIRNTIAAKMYESWSTIPRVTNFDDADVTELEAMRQTAKPDYAQAGIKLTTMPFVIKAVAMALKRNPDINASLDLEQKRIVYKDYVNIGIAVDTDRGLVVPSLRNADQLSVPEIARGLSELAARSRKNQHSIDDLRGSTFTISNLGAVGGSYSTPIINPPEVAILLTGRSRKIPAIVDDQVQVRLMMPLSISYDHRLVDGATAARFLNDVIDYLEAPSRTLLAP